MPSYAAIVLAGGAARRMGGAPKPLLPVRGVPLLTRVLDAVAEAEPVIVVGPPSLRAQLPVSVLLTREEPPGGGPVAALAAGLAELAGLGQGPGAPEAGNVIAVLAADLPFLTATALALLRERLQESGADVALFRDDRGRRQQLCALWRADALVQAVPVPAAGVAMRDLLAAADVAEVDWAGAGPAPWYDCDTPAELAHAEEM
jgi:molybdopterin-guanine dinucleotide biosynthesis protein A